MMERLFDGKKVEHQTLSIKPQDGASVEDVQGHDIGKKLFASSLDLYDHMGVERIETYANCDIGGYAWARYGFVPDQKTWNFMREQLTMRLPSITNDAVKARVEGLLKLEDPRVIGVLAAMKQPVYGKATQLPVGFGMLKNAGWDGVLDLTNPKRYEIVRAYVGA